ncbi:hypothetical protein OIU84_018837 [Salix udensis]|uniref:Uncharacterized protein n=1 Tax=Salix udensis TaxID=889485 RepID=A0AAD6KXE3_9ROSI|nr:hypothetical protein OIU84_018837 [Salix udensis]
MSQGQPRSPQAGGQDNPMRQDRPLKIWRRFQGFWRPEDADQCGKHRTWTGPEGWSSCYRAICCTAMSKLEKHWKLHHSNAAAIHAADQVRATGIIVIIPGGLAAGPAQSAALF